jgi:hypothetical protein
MLSACPYHLSWMDFINFMYLPLVICSLSPCSGSPAFFFYGPIYFNITQLVPTFMSFNEFYIPVLYEYYSNFIATTIYPVLFPCWLLYIVSQLHLQVTCFPAGCCTLCLNCTCKLHVSLLPAVHCVSVALASYMFPCWLLCIVSPLHLQVTCHSSTAL